MTIAGAVILAAIAATLHWKRRVPRLVNWLLLFVGVGAATVITNALGGFSGISFFGVGVFTLVAIVAGIAFWEEAVKKNGLHHIRTPIIALAFGVALMGVGGTVGSAINHAVQTGGQNVNKVVTDSISTKK